MFWHCIRVFKRCHFFKQKGSRGPMRRLRLNGCLNRNRKSHTAAAAAASLLILGSDAACNVCTFECSGVCWLTVPIKPSYRGCGYLSHSHLMASSCNMCQSQSAQPDSFACRALRRKGDITANHPVFAAEGHVKLWRCFSLTLEYNLMNCHLKRRIQAFRNPSTH